MSSLSAITVGNFDGVHLGHAELIRSARKAVGPSGRVLALSFDPHPLSVLMPERVPGRLTDFENRSRMLQDLGADQVVRLHPAQDFLDQSAVDFVAWIVSQYHPQIVVEGPDFRFGHDREGTVRMLRDLEGRHGYQTIVIDPVQHPLSDGQIVNVSSSILRWLICQGRVTDASRLLGRSYEVIGEVVSGDRRGRTIGVPTANLDHKELLLPADGVYAGRAQLPDGAVYPAAISVGRKPTFKSNARICEAHLISYDGPLDHYGWTLRVGFDHWLRDQITFPDVKALTKQLQRDIDRARSASSLIQV